MITKIEAAKGNAYKVTSVEEVKVILDSLEVTAYDDSLDLS
jgi:hypothetical protein